MNSRMLSHFAAVVDQGSLNRAASVLQISQPALSMSISKLERSLGCQLLERTSSGVEPTAAGELLYGHARYIRDEMELAEARVGVRGQAAEGVTTFGTLPSLAQSIVPKAVTRWYGKYPDFTLRITEQVQSELLFSLLRGKVDFIVAQSWYYSMKIFEGFKQRRLFSDQLYVVAHPHHRALQAGPPTWDVLAGYPWIMQAIETPYLFLKKLFLAEDTNPPKRLIESRSVGCIKELILNSDSLGVLPSSAIGNELNRNELAVVPVASPLLRRDITLLYCEQFPITPRAQSLIEEIQAIGKDLELTQAAH